MDAAPATAPPGDPGLQSAPGGAPPGMTSGGAGGAPSGVLPPSASAPPSGANIHPAGVHQVGMEMMRKIMGAMHIAIGMLDPSSKESDSVISMLKTGKKHFIPDMSQGQQGMPPGIGMGAPGGALQGGLPAMNPNRMPTGPPPMRGAPMGGMR